MKFADFVCFKANVPRLSESLDRDGAITELISSLDRAGALPKGTCQELIEAVILRENEASTGLGRGVAVPHVKHAAIKQVVGVVGISEPGLDFSALDKQPVYSILLLLSPAGNPDVHLQTMEMVFAHLQKEKFRRFLRQCADQAALEDLLREADESPSW
jgi:mannitol/fructose-specific phosphotransferase system IIA component (Ntr-type)